MPYTLRLLEAGFNVLCEKPLANRAADVDRLVAASEASGKLLSIFQYVAAVLLAVMACFPAIYVVLGVLMVTAPSSMAGGGQPPPPFMGWMFILIGSAVPLALAWPLAARSASSSGTWSRMPQGTNWGPSVNACSSASAA